MVEVLRLASEDIHRVCVAEGSMAFALERDAPGALHFCEGAVLDVFFFEQIAADLLEVEDPKIVEEDVLRHVDPSEHEHLFVGSSRMAFPKPADSVLMTSIRRIYLHLLPSLLIALNIHCIKVSQTFAFFALPRVYEQIWFFENIREKIYLGRI
jgi:hypothetical protein